MPDVLPPTVERDGLPTDLDLCQLQRTTLLYYLHETNPDNDEPPNAKADT
jgi:hypothetical protein